MGLLMYRFYLKRLQLGLMLPWGEYFQVTSWLSIVTLCWLLEMASMMWFVSIDLKSETDCKCWIKQIICVVL